MFPPLPSFDPRSRFVLASVVLLAFVNLFSQSIPQPIGTFSGTMSSRHYGSFPVTINIAQDNQGKLRGATSVVARCFSNPTVLVTVSGTSITLAGSDEAGNNITFRGQIDPTTSQLTLSYIANGSASGRCETDDGWGSLNKR